MSTENYPKMVIYGDIPSKANSYKIITINGHSSLTKTPVVKKYESDFALQCPMRGANINQLFKLELDVYNSSNRKDLDGSFKVFLDCLQSCKVIKNDRLCVEIHARKLVDKVNPRVEFRLVPVMNNNEDVSIE